MLGGQEEMLHTLSSDRFEDHCLAAKSHLEGQLWVVRVDRNKRRILLKNSSLIAA
ncbi:hypothetical protein [Roseovarius sp. ZX-A-9]|uniref:hypothetical protein n=1 Tax=Roseovarius sp. ZX-A-9 TaxID=3014783 RepID=UPI0023305F76|nr:hypothetical protein [Roseovarius sp. ZX-A-9]